MKNNGININEWVNALSDQKLFYLAVITKTGQVTFINSHLFNSLHLTADSITNRNFFELLHPDDRQSCLQSMEVASRSHAAESKELRIKNGHSRWVKWQITCMNHTGKELDKFLCLGYDIPCEEQVRKFTSISDRNYQAIVEGLNVGLIFQDNRGSLISANQKAAEILNVSLENLYRNGNIYPLWKTTNAEGNPLPFAEAPFMKALSRGETQTNVLLNLQVGDGIERNVLCNSQPLFEKDQSVPFSVVSTILDITNEKKLEMEAKSRTALFRSFMAHTPYFTWIVDRDENLVFANQSLLNYFKGDETAFGKNMFHLIPTNIAAIFHEKHLSVFKKQIEDHSIVKSLMADGKERVYQLTVFPIHGASPSELVGGEALDITEAYNARQEIKNSNERLLYMSKATSEAIWDWNMRNGVIFCNQSLHGLIGTDLNQVYDMNWFYRRIHPEDKSKVEWKIKKVLERKEKSWEAEYRFQSIDGEYKMVYNRGFVIYEDNLPIRMIGSLQDISEVRQLESQLVDQKLKQQKGIAEAIIHSQEEERTRIGHELHDNVNQILSTAQLYLSMLGPKKNDFEEVKEKASEMIMLGIEEIRKLSRQMVVANLNEGGLLESIKDIVADLRFINPFNIVFNHNQHCDVEVLSKNKKITLFRIVQEQIKNIVKYSGSKNVEISLFSNPEQVKLVIRDDGIGFDSKNTRRGLGLSNIYERTRLDNGKVILDTAPGKGCCLTVSLPSDNKSLFSS
jgi:PAS domain S-box-containing protein